MANRLRHQQVVPPLGGLPTKRFLTDTGNGLGTLNYNGNYSVTPKSIYYQSTGRFEIASFLINISSPAKAYQTGYGSISGGLTNGVSFYVRAASGVEIPILTDIPIKKNYEYFRLTAETFTSDFDGLAQTLNVFISMQNQYGGNFSIKAGEQIKVVLNDDFSALVNHSFSIFGMLYP